MPPGASFNRITSYNVCYTKLLRIADFAEKMTQYVENNYENVGTSVAKQALEMHYGVTEFKQIRGTTTKEEEKTLEKEGVPVFKLPILNKDNEDLN